MGALFSVQGGWYPLVVALDKAMSAIDPAYVLLQGKQKYAELRWYYRSTDPALEPALDALVKTAGEEARRTCERCGAAGQTRRDLVWVEVLCDDHYAVARTRRR